MSSTYLPRQIAVGPNSLEQLGEIAIGNDASKLFVVIDGFLVTSDIQLDKRIGHILQKEGLEVTFFSDYQGEPTTDHLESALNLLHTSQADCVVAIGGGSAIDIAKAVSLFALNIDLAWDEITSKNRLKRLPLIAIPTTAGTGSEATKVMVIKDMKTDIKMNPGHKDLVPDVAILDPELTTSLPKHFTAYTGLDALAHAMEAYVSTLACDTTDSYALNAIRLIGKALPNAYKNGSDIKAREQMLLASCYAGIAFSNASTNLAHAAGRPLGARFHIPHGLSIALLLPFVVDLGLEEAEERYAEIAIEFGEEEKDNPKQLAQKTRTKLDYYNDQFQIWEDGLKYIDIEDFRENIPLLVNDALNGNGIITNPKVPQKSDIENIYHSLLKKLTETAMNKVF
ncbi:iron-containing alcohol dehydrogenase [Oceanobacillus massiliensis]|uniref:iron-containing alcohol dehydrogenase n=1 Tax=Oceanobacillus massiliensis TaxID=1465765 RepID=UPI0002897B58|nr:iron-containing alcohol dehydrogenase [Oceanobacillus massiliensis]